MKTSKITPEISLKLQSITNSNLVKKSKGTSISDLMIEVLKDGSKLTRIELTNEISIIRYEEAFTKIDDNEITKPEFLENWSKINTTVKNGIDTSISKNNREPQYGSLTLKVNDNKYSLVK